MLKPFLGIWLIAASFLVPSFPTQAEGIPGNSILCTQRGWITGVALSTREFNVAICYDGYDISANHYYIGQDRKSNNSIALPLVMQQDSSSGEIYPHTWEHGGQLFKAVNGQFTYQVFTSNDYYPKDDWATLTVFKNGSKIYHQKVMRYISCSQCDA